MGPALEIMVLWALAGAQPVLDLFGRNPAFFLASGTGPAEIVAFAVLVAFAVPALLVALEVVVRRLRPVWAPGLHLAQVPADVDFDGGSLVDPAFERPAGDKPVYFHRGPTTVPGDFSDVVALAARNALAVGDGGWLDLLRVGPAGPLVGRRVIGLAPVAPVDGTWRIDQEEQLRSTPGGRLRPVAVAGALRLDDEEAVLPEQVLVAVDGILAGIGDLETSDGRFAALLDERRLSPGDHQVDLYLPTAGGSVRLIREA